MADRVAGGPVDQDSGGLERVCLVRAAGEGIVEVDGESIAGEIRADKVAQNEVAGREYVEIWMPDWSFPEITFRRSARAADQVVGRVVNQNPSPFPVTPPRGRRPVPRHQADQIALDDVADAGAPYLRANELNSDVGVARDEVTRAGGGTANRLAKGLRGDVVDEDAALAVTDGVGLRLVHGSDDVALNDRLRLAGGGSREQN